MCRSGRQESFRPPSATQARTDPRAVPRSPGSPPTAPKVRAPSAPGNTACGLKTSCGVNCALTCSAANPRPSAAQALCLRAALRSSPRHCGRLRAWTPSPLSVRVPSCLGSNVSQASSRQRACPSYLSRRNRWQRWATRRGVGSGRTGRGASSRPRCAPAPCGVVLETVFYRWCTTPETVFFWFLPLHNPTFASNERCFRIHTWRFPFSISPPTPPTHKPCFPLKQTAFLPPETVLPL